MFYWLPRIFIVLFIGAVVGLGLVPSTSQDVANTVMVIVVGLGLFSLTLHVFPPERY